MHRLMEFFRDEGGASAVEYALMVALIAATIITAVSLLSDQIETLFGSNEGISNALNVD
jgi:pilus assembly protein Flp/PilA